MDLLEISAPPRPENGNIFFGTPLTPQQRIQVVSSEEFEQIVHEWAYDFLKKKYHAVYQLGGSGDKGRDIIAYIDDTKKLIDIYQCKHYQKPLTPSQYWVEFGKLCYYTFNGDYPVPKNYFIVASQGLGQDLKDYLEKPEKINQALIDNWDKYCRKGITQKKEVILEPKLLSYIQAFDFKIVQEISILRLLDEYSQTKWFKYRFGGGLKKRPKAEKPPKTLDESERNLPYVIELLKAYSEHENTCFPTVESLNGNEYLKDHFQRQRVDYHSAQSLKRFSRDEFIDEDPYTEAKEEIYSGVVDICLQDYKSGLIRVNTTLSEARKISLDGNELGKINPSDKSGMCHELVNEFRLKWVK
ncbi:ABC-three component system protein [Parageobacillus thermoglucosidasius]|uniref:ABC-three component system protein n=1 Tax=Parageobacillus thermoglucosidasius TaxID=1426 RepID=UPI000B54C9C3|nr:ABC-three component system protein [Parageobacillus thermoglucosidasius]MBY6269793.1 hypothetical protein [Parageobacillus thermoglucosidasius]OUM92121.1 MAG: hypothetical protein BAA00_04340 [Parageobacillus thermoglucosidasius]RDE28984.1 hypothetical protein DV714_07850 [Parageobacillus thermoglucosidasius]